MPDSITESPGLAVAGNIKEPPKRRHRSTKAATIAAAAKRKEKTLAERAKALKERKNPTYRLLLRVDEETYAAVVALGERSSLVVEDAAIRALREGLRKYENVSLNPLPFAEEGLHEIPAGERIAGLYGNGTASPYIPEDVEAKKRLVKAIGLQTNG